MSNTVTRPDECPECQWDGLDGDGNDVFDAYGRCRHRGCDVVWWEHQLLQAKRQIDAAVDVAIRYGPDETHHQAWVIDQVLRHLLGDDYDRAIAESCDGEDGPNTHSHDVGIPP